MDSHPIVIRDVAHFIGVDARGLTVYEAYLSLADFYGEVQIWDFPREVLELGIVRLAGQLHGTDGQVFQECESAYCEETGKRIGGRVTQEDGSVRVDGCYA